MRRVRFFISACDYSGGWVGEKANLESGASVTQNGLNETLCCGFGVVGRSCARSSGDFDRGSMGSSGASVIECDGGVYEGHEYRWRERDAR